VSDIETTALSQDVAASRLVRVTRDGGEALKHFDSHTLANFRKFKLFPKITTLSPKLNELMKELFNQYQLEIVRPNLKFIENNHSSAYDNAPTHRTHFLTEHKGPDMTAPRKKGKQTKTYAKVINSRQMDDGITSRKTKQVAKEQKKVLTNLVDETNRNLINSFDYE